MTAPDYFKYASLPVSTEKEDFNERNARSTLLEQSVAHQIQTALPTYLGQNVTFEIPECVEVDLDELKREYRTDGDFGIQHYYKYAQTDILMKIWKGDELVQALTVEVKELSPSSEYGEWRYLADKPKYGVLMMPKKQFDIKNTYTGLPDLVVCVPNDWSSDEYDCGVHKLIFIQPKQLKTKDIQVKWVSPVGKCVFVTKEKCHFGWSSFLKSKVEGKYLDLSEATVRLVPDDEGLTKYIFDNEPKGELFLFTKADLGFESKVEGFIIFRINDKGEPEILGRYMFE
jgi:hypothetical protein